jgi:hypothetical protein
LFNRTILLDGGVFSYSGNNSNFVYSRIILADGCAYTYSGNDANLVYATAGSYTLSANTGTFSYSGNNVNLIYPKTVAADGGIYTYFGNASNLLYNRRIIADGGTYSYSGNNANLTYATVGSYTLVADTGTLSYSGNNATLTYSGASTACPTAQEIAQEVWNYILEGSVSAGQMLRGVTRTQLARVDINETTGQVTIYKLDGTTVFAQASTSPTGDRNAPTVDWN